MPKKIPGIVDEKGRMKVALAGEYIGAEHPNAATDWTRRYHAAANHEHDDSGRHNRGYHCIGALQLMMPRWDANGALLSDAEILSGQLYEHDLKSYQGNLFQASAVSFGRVRVSLDIPLPSQYFILPGNSPQPFPYEDAGGPGVGRRVFHVDRINDDVFEIDIGVIGGGLVPGRTGRIRSPVTLRIYGAARPVSAGGPLSDYVRHRLVEGGLGEVVPADMYQAVADFQRAAVDHLSLDHHREWNGIPGHRGMRWFKAVSSFEVVSGDSQRNVEPELRYHFSYGFRKAPSIRAEARFIYGMSFHAWWMDWQALDDSASGFLVGLRTHTPFDHGVHGPGEMVNGVGWYRLGVMTRHSNPEGDSFEPSLDMLRIRHVTLAVY